MAEPTQSGIQTPSRTVGARFSNVQYKAIRRILGEESDTDYIRRLVAEDMHRQRVDLPDYEFVTNIDRKNRRVRGRGVKQHKDRLGRLFYTAKCPSCTHRRRLKRIADSVYVLWHLECSVVVQVEVFGDGA